MSNFQLYKKVISATGTTSENEPVIKSDGDGEVMQWIPSDGVAADGITFDEPSAGAPLRLGIGVAAPDASFHVKSPDFDVARLERSDAGSPAIMLKNSGGLLGGVVGVNGGGLELRTNDPATTKLTISSAGTHTITPAGNVKGLYFPTAPTTTDNVIFVEANALTTGRAGYFYSNSADTSTRQIVRIINDHASATGATCLEVRNDSTGRAITAIGGIVEEDGVLKENLLTNSGFDVWSNSTLEDVATVAEDDCASDDTGDWTEAGSAAAPVFDTDHYELFFFDNMMESPLSKHQHMLWLQCDHKFPDNLSCM